MGNYFDELAQQSLAKLVIGSEIQNLPDGNEVLNKNRP